MKQLAYTDLDQHQVVDTRSQLDFQNGHLAQSMNMTIGNFKKYALNFLEVRQPLVFITGEDARADLEELLASAAELGFTSVSGYLPIEAIPAESLQKSAVISAEEFLEADEDFILLDVRHPDEITRKAPEKNLVNIPLEDLSENVDQLDKRKTVYTLCGSGNRGTSAASFLASKDFEPVVIAGGMKAIQAIQTKK